MIHHTTGRAYTRRVHSKSSQAGAGGAGARRGFTLLELIVVLTLLGILSSIVVPVYVSSMEAITLRSSRSDFLSLLFFVQERAVAESREFRLYIDDSTHSYWVMAMTGLDRDYEKVFEPVEAEYGIEQFLPSYLRFERVSGPKDRDRDAFYIACYPNGACTPATIRFIDERDRSNRFKVEVLGFMGKVEVDQ